MSSPKLSTAEVSKENVFQPKKGKRKLFRNEISSPINISGQVVSYYLVFISIKLFFNSKVFITLNFMIIIFKIILFLTCMGVLITFMYHMHAWYLWKL